MFGLFRRGALLGTELSDWQFGCFEWLLRHTGGLEAFQQRRLIQPTPQFFPHDGSRGHAFAEMIFNQVKGYAGMVEWPCVLQCQEEDPNPHVAPALLIQGSPQSPAGTFRATEEGALITYHPHQLQNPMALVATFAHELAHYLIKPFPEPPPGGWEVWEPATDLTAVFMGFGIFLANSRFNFTQYSNGQTMGWRSQRLGYLSEPEVLHMHAIFSVVRGIEQRETLSHLKPALRGIYKRVYKDVAEATKKGIAPHFLRGIDSNSRVADIT